MLYYMITLNVKCYIMLHVILHDNFIITLQLLHHTVIKKINCIILEIFEKVELFLRNPKIFSGFRIF